MSNSFYDAILDRFQAYVADLSNVVDLISDQRTDKEQTLEALAAMGSTAQKINQRIDAARSKIEATVSPA